VTTGTGESAPVAVVAIQPSTTSLSVGSTLQLTVVLRDAVGRVLENRTITFASSNESVVSVDATGLVRALADGEATITATSEEQSGQMSISVGSIDPCLGCWDY
jgi:uncharacterized protein YjdB